MYEKLGVLGGTFDPIHYGHLYIAENAREVFGLDKIIFIPSGDTPHKDASVVTDKTHRLAMTRLACEGNEGFEVSAIEHDHDGVCYTIDTINELKKIHSSARIHFIIGNDCLYELGTWRNYGSLFKMIDIIAVNRTCVSERDAQSVADQYINDHFAKIHILDLPVYDVSSTNIRRRISAGKTTRYMLPDKVLDYILENRLYVDKRE